MTEKDKQFFESMRIEPCDVRKSIPHDWTESATQTVVDGYADGEYSDEEEDAKAELIYKAQRAVDAVRLHEESIRVLSIVRGQMGGYDLLKLRRDHCRGAEEWLSINDSE